ncbi:hypothetical protein ABZP36_026493 [Zizania latifolia]
MIMPEECRSCMIDKCHHGSLSSSDNATSTWTTERKQKPSSGHLTIAPDHKEEEEELTIQTLLSMDKDTVLSKGRKLAKSDVAKLKEQYSPSILYEHRYFQYYEDSLEWYFDHDCFEPAGFDDYQRLVLCDNGLYLSLDEYQSSCNTYESELAYVKYHDELAKETRTMNGAFHFIVLSIRILMYDAYVSCIDEMVPEDEAHQLIKEATIKMVL